MAFSRPGGTKLAAEQLLQYAVRILSGRSYSIGEIETKIKARAAVETDVREILSRLKQMGFLNDRRFADSVSSARRDNQGVGQSRVMRELAQRKVPRIVAESAVREAYAATDEAAMALQFIERKLRSVNPPEYLAEPKHLQSAFRRLRYGGFSAAASIKALKRFSELAGELEDMPGDEEV